MSYQAFQSVSGPLATASVSSLMVNKTIKYGTKSDVDINVSGDESFDRTRVGATFTNVLSTFGVLEPHVFHDADVYDGISAQLINDEGYLDPGQLADAMKRTGKFRPFEIAAFTDDIVARSHDNHVGVLYNMIRLWVIAEARQAAPTRQYLAEQARMKAKGRLDAGDARRGGFNSISDAFTINQDDVFYDDGHVAVSYKDYLGRPFSGEFNISFDAMLNTPVAELATMTADAYCPRLNGFSPADFAVLNQAVGGWNSTTPVRIMHSCPPLANAIYCTPESGLAGSCPVSYELFNSAQYRATLAKYVNANRVQAQFDIAYFMAVQALYAPLPRAIEANGWVSPVNTINIPRAYSLRGIDNVICSGARYSPYAEAELTWTNFFNNPHVLAIHAIGATEAFFTGIFELMTATGQGLADVLYKLGMDSVYDATPLAMFMEAATYRFGKALETAWRTEAGINYVEHLMHDRVEQFDINITSVGPDVSGYKLYVIDEAGVPRTRLVAPELRPVLFPILSMGINTDKYYPNAYKNELEFKYDTSSDSYVFRGSSEANKALNMLRVIGYDAIIINAISRLAYRNWAANSNGHVMPMVPPDNGESIYMIQARDISPRRKHWTELPLDANFKLTTVVKPRNYVIYASGKEVRVFHGLRKAIAEMPKPITLENMPYTKLPAKSLGIKWRGVGFQLACRDEAAVAAMPISLSAVTTQLPPVEESAQADDGAEESTTEE